VEESLNVYPHLAALANSNPANRDTSVDMTTI
jgi:hypothetical protein